MVSPGVRPALTLTAVCFVLIGLSSPPASAQSAALEYGELQREILTRIERVEVRDGPYSPALRDELQALIQLYREHDDHALAVAAIERALQVVRANDGLYSLEQVPLLWQRLQSEEARGNDTEVWDLQQDLLRLARRYPDDLRAVPVLRDVAERQWSVLERVVTTGEIPPEVIHGCFYEEWPNSPRSGCLAGSRTTVVQGMLAEANRNQADAIAILLRNEAYSSEALRELEMELVRGADLIRTEYERQGFRGITGSRIRNDEPVPLAPWTMVAEYIEPWRSRMAPIIELADWALPDPGGRTPEEDDFVHRPEPRDARFRSPYLRGRQSLRRMYSYVVADAGSPQAQAEAIVQIADWDLLFSHNGLALEGYALAQTMLDGAERQAASLFAPDLPVVLPSFEPNPLARDETRPAIGHVDVTFAITRFGRVDDLEIRATENADKEARDDLSALIKSSRFRPRLSDGRFAQSVPVALRYYLYSQP